MRNMLIDANIFLEVLLEQERSNKCKAILKRFQKGKQQGIISSFTVDAIMLIVTRYKKENIELFLNSLLNYKGLKIYQITVKDRLEAISLMKTNNLDYEDAITLQAAFSNNLSEILSLDKHFDKVKEIKRIEP